MELNDLIRDFERYMCQFVIVRDCVEWQTLKTAVSEQTAHNTARDAIAAFNAWYSSGKYESTVSAGFMYGYAAGMAAKAPVA